MSVKTSTKKTKKFQARATIKPPIFHRAMVAVRGNAARYYSPMGEKRGAGSWSLSIDIDEMNGFWRWRARFNNAADNNAAELVAPGHFTSAQLAADDARRVLGIVSFALAKDVQCYVPGESVADDEHASDVIRRTRDQLDDIKSNLDSLAEFLL